MKITDVPVVQRFIRFCEDGWNQGWHERNGGNLTYRLTQAEIDALRPFFDRVPRPWTDMGVQGTNLAGAYFLATGSGKYFRNVPLDAADCLCVVEIDSTGSRYRVVWGLVNGGRPTSEFPSHFMNHSVRARATQGECRVIYHAHPANITALTFVLPLTDRDFSRALWKSETECPVVFPGGVGVVEWMVPGGAEIALATSKKMEEYDAVVWAHHGLFASGPEFDTTFGLMHTIEKAAQIYVLALGCGQGIRQTIPDDGLRAIAREFGVTIREAFLD